MVFSFILYKPSSRCIKFHHWTFEHMKWQLKTDTQDIQNSQSEIIIQKYKTVHTHIHIWAHQQKWKQKRYQSLHGKQKENSSIELKPGNHKIVLVIEIWKFLERAKFREYIRRIWLVYRFRISRKFIVYFSIGHDKFIYMLYIMRLKQCKIESNAE